MNNWLNAQNKQHFALYNNDGNLVLKEDNITWMDMLFLQRSEKLNKRVSKVSPRRGKNQEEALLQRFFEGEEITLQMAEAFASLDEHGNL